jgi:hypothetical protein
MDQHNEVGDEPRDFLIYKGNNGDVRVDVHLQDETLWLTQKAMSDLFDVKVPAISKHLKNIFASEELVEDVVVSILEIPTAHGAIAGKIQKIKTKFYNLDAIISVGYRVNSRQATQFRIWATRMLREFIVKGFVMDDERLKQASSAFGKDYFDELLERIREIRASERRFYQKVTDLYALSIDYDKHAPITRDFFASVQNKLHWAISGQTAAEIIYSSVDATKLYMGLTNWQQAPEGKILKSDISIAKNYLNKAHIDQLNQVVVGYLDLAESRAKRQISMKMSDWLTLLHSFLELSLYPILSDKGKVSALSAKLKAEGEYEKYRVIQDREFQSDFDEEVKRFLGKNNSDD